MTFLDGNNSDMIKLSEVVLDFADELLLAASTREAKERSIMLAIVAWNIGLLEEDAREEKINDFLLTMKMEEDSDDWYDMFDIMDTLAYKKQTEYGSVNRHIVDFNFSEIRAGDYHLSIASSVLAN